MKESYEYIYNYNFCCECGSPPNITFENMQYYFNLALDDLDKLEEEDIGNYCKKCPRWICSNCVKNNDICSCCRSGGDYRNLEQIQITNDIKKYIDKYSCTNCGCYLNYNRNFIGYKHGTGYGFFDNENGNYDRYKCKWYCFECANV